MLELLVAVERLSIHKDPGRGGNSEFGYWKGSPGDASRLGHPTVCCSPELPFSELKGGKGPNFCNEQGLKWTKAEV